FAIFLAAMFAETNRLPFDLPESEQELAGGYNVEYSSMKFALFFMGEYAAMTAASAMLVTLFLGGWTLPFAGLDKPATTLGIGVAQIGIFLAKMCCVEFMVIWVRWMWPRFRYDQLMDLGWKWMLPAALINIVMTAIGVTVIQGLDNPNGMRTIKSLTTGLGLTASGKAIAIVIGIVNLFITAGLLSLINWRSRDFNLKSQRRQIRLVDPPKGRPAVVPIESVSEARP
ncbi:MAG TPA: complex I subunit 1 family protein, partial [Candidatus Binatus sp.]|nr:complex I subunit 1 family protein [Candidatus Binatus sp.]